MSRMKVHRKYSILFCFSVGSDGFNTPEGTGNPDRYKILDRTSGTPTGRSSSNVVPCSVLS